VNERCIVNVSTGFYVRGQMRLLSALNGDNKAFWSDRLPEGCPAHHQVPYAFKAFALNETAKRYPVLLWLDAAILPGPRPFEDLWQRIERDGYWFSKNGWKNSHWTNHAALPDLGVSPAENETIEHVVATAFGLNLNHPIGKAFLTEYFRMANTKAFCGPWRGGKGLQHRHDQTAASVIAHKLGMKLTAAPEWFAYRGGETKDTVLIADRNF
jgi:hypothetical protein